MLACVALLGPQLTYPESVAAASLKQQVAAAKKRQAELSKSIAKQEKLLKDLAADQTATKNALRSTADKLKDIARDQDNVRAQVEKAERALDRAQAKYGQLLEELDQTDYTLGLLEQELLSGEEDLRARQAALAQRLAEAYSAENTTLLEQVFTAESFSDVLTDASASLAFGELDLLLAEEITADQQALDTLRLLTTTTRLQTDKLRRDTADTKADIRERRKELNKRKRELIRLEKKTEQIQRAQRAQYDKIITNAKQARAQRSKLVNAVAAVKRQIQSKLAAARSKARRLGGDPRGGFDWPARGTISGNYGCSSFRFYPIRNGCPWHDGIDIAGSHGSPIWAAQAGVVVFSGYRPDGALVIVIAHSNGLETTYAHMSSVAVGSGAVVKKGQRIGGMGCTGFCTGTHLHWEVSRNLVTLNPRSFL